MPSEKSIANLRPIKKGEKLALKDKSDRKDRRVVILMTDKDYTGLERKAKFAKMAVSKYVRGKLDIG